MKERIIILKSEIEKDCKKLNKLFAKFEKAYNTFLTSGEYSKLVESAFYVNQLYTGFENIFKNIARTFENAIEEDGWHKSLLERMNLDIQDIRPAVISEESFNCLNELRVFRHFFRHAYDVDINREKFKIVADRAITANHLFHKDINNFISFLERLIK